MNSPSVQYGEYTSVLSDPLITQGTLINQGTFSTALSKINVTTLTNNGTLNVEGALDRSIGGTGTTNINEGLSITSDITVEGKLRSDTSGTINIDMQNGVQQ